MRGSERTTQVYRPAGSALLRASAHPTSVTRRPWPDQDDADVDQWCRWLVGVWAQQPVAAAVEMASPVLAGRIETVCRGQRPRPAEVRRMVLALARYLVRMRGRATPFGLFAGVSAVRFGTEA